MIPCLPLKIDELLQARELLERLIERGDNYENERDETGYRNEYADYFRRGRNLPPVDFFLVSPLVFLSVVVAAIFPRLPLLQFLKNHFGGWGEGGHKTDP